MHEILLFCLAISTCSQQVSSFATARSQLFRRESFGAFLPRSATTLWVNVNSDDPFEILDLKPTADLDKKQIKRAYKRLALKYHPDVVVNPSSTPEEKAKAGEVFAKINWAYATLSGKNGESTTTTTSSGTGTTTKNAGYQPPHRRKAYTNPSTSTDWQDYMPKYNDEDYNADGDSFGQIFSELLTGVAGVATGAAVGGGGVFRDFVEFLERNVDGYSGGENDADLLSLLTTGTLEDVGNEMDDTDLVLQQLNSKMKNIENELIMIQAELKVATKFSEKLDLQERVAEQEARMKVVKGYAEKARKRLLSLQTRYKALIVGGLNDRQVGGRSRSSSPSSSSPTSSDSFGYTTSATSATAGSRYNRSNNEDDDTWKSQGFSSSGRRGSSRRRRPDSPAEEPQPSPPRPDPQYQSATRSSSSTVPPHRRTSSVESDDKRRLREIKVDEEFERLKKELGL